MAALRGRMADVAGPVRPGRWVRVVRRLRQAGIPSILLAVAGLANSAMPGSAAVSADGPGTAIEAYLRAEMAGSAIPGLAVAVVEDGRTTYAAALGSAVDGSPMTIATPVVIGSVGKSITALAIRQLVEAGRLELGVPLRTYLPWFTLDAPRAAVDAITVGSLLAHTSGLSTADGQDPRWYAPGLSPGDVARGLVSVQPDRPAGVHEYSNLNYVLLGVLVESVSGQAYDAYLADHVFRPLGMAASAAMPGPADGTPTGYRYLYGVPVPFAEPYPTGMVAAGYQVSTTEDMARFTAALASGGVYEGTDILTGRPSAGPGPALGTDWQSIGAVTPGTVTGQSGSTLATNADILVEPASHRGVVVLLDANPVQFMGLPRGAADIALDVLRISEGDAPAAGRPSVRMVYLVLDLLLAALVALLVVHAWRSRTWPDRWRRDGSRRLLGARTVAADLVLPVIVLVGIPLAIGATGSSPAGDVFRGWRFLFWTLPDVAVALLVLATVPLALGLRKVIAVARGRADARQSPGAQGSTAG
jgi:CubicO group peptidase (beta-lactamase class C family)